MKKVDILVCAASLSSLLDYKAKLTTVNKYIHKDFSYVLTTCTLKLSDQLPPLQKNCNLYYEHEITRTHSTIARSHV